MLTQHLKQGAMKGGFATEPLIDQHTYGVLIARGAGSALDLFGSHVDGGPSLTLGRERVQAVLNHCNTKITEHDFIIGREQHIFWFDIAMDHTLLMSVI